MKLVALIQSPVHVCYRYRLRPFEPALEAAGIHVERWPIARGLFRRWRQFRRLRKADAVFLQRKLFSPWEIVLLRRSARRLIYDVDDAVYRRDSFQPGGASSWYRRLRFAMTVRAADLVLAGNHFLATVVRHLQRDARSTSRNHPLGQLADRLVADGFGSRCVVVPTGVDPSAYPLARHEDHPGTLRLVWIGSAATLPSLEMAGGLLRAVAARVPQALLRVVCDRLPGLSGIALELWPWSETSEALALATADVGIAWMPPDGWSRGKCGLKLLQYMAAGLPVLANPVGVHREMVITGKTGELARSAEEWADVIRRWADSPRLREVLGRQGRMLVEARYSPAVWAPVVARIIAGLVRGTNFVNQADEEEAERVDVLTQFAHERAA